MVSFNSRLNSFLVLEFLQLSSNYNRMPLIFAQYTSIKKHLRASVLSLSKMLCPQEFAHSKLKV